MVIDPIANGNRGDLLRRLGLELTMNSGFGPRLGLGFGLGVGGLPMLMIANNIQMSLEEIDGVGARV